MEGDCVPGGGAGEITDREGVNSDGKASGGGDVSIVGGEGDGDIGVGGDLDWL